MTRLHVLRVTEEELIKIQDAIDDAFSPGIERRSAEAHARLALRLHDLTGEELDPDVEQFCSAFMPGNTASR